MKATGMVRPIDNLGRIVLPKSIREAYDIKIKDPMEIFTDGESIIIKKYSPACIFCNETKDISVFKEKKVCSHCLKELTKL